MKRLPIVSNSSLQQARALITSIVETVREPLVVATVLGIVEQSSGRIQFSSELDRGTSFWVNLPRVEGTPASEVRREYTTMPTGSRAGQSG
jgi:hypothetical protein